MPDFKEIYVERYKKLLGDEWDIFKEAIVRPFPSSFRINTIKAKRSEVVENLEQKGWKIKQIPFYENGYYFYEAKAVVLGNTLEHFLGHFYIQETASMIPAVLLAPNEEDCVLDLAAAPGSKTTQMAEMMKNEGAIVANEKVLGRLTALRMNLQRCGVINTVLTQMDGRAFRRIEMQFDKILLDAPCTGTGTIMKSPHTIKTWSVKASQILGRLQRQLLESAVHVLKPGGTLVYSTCSLEPEEDEENVDFAVKELGLKVEQVHIPGFKTREGITSWEGKNYDESIRKCLRIYPQDNNTEGFFAAKLKKEG
jgi:NOL1/NOP2/sun family putative RNA methylase